VPGSGFSETTRLAVPAGVAFDFLADPSTARLIDPAIREYRPDTVPLRVGTRIRIRLRLWGLPVRAESVVRAWDEGRRMVMESVRPSWPVRVVATHSFAPDGEGCTYTWAVEVVPAGRLGRVVARPLLRSLAANARAQQIRFGTEVVRRPR
jgi:ligand-binding SRPBCC domain-containing protein